MDKSEIKDYLKMVDDLETRLTGEDRETLAWLIYGYNQCAKLLNETEQQVKKQKEVIDKATNELFILKDMIYKPETREENFEIQRKISLIIKRLNGKEASE